MAVYQVMNIHFAVMKSRSTFRSSRLFRGEIKRFRWNRFLIPSCDASMSLTSVLKCKKGIRHLQNF